MVKIMESTMTKISKLRSLARELQKKYKADAETLKSLASKYVGMYLYVCAPMTPCKP